mmetsp:Transcript_16782/g.48203  ORF Transcript_16782/g.48203 Transcript_16782/m.48203 type:complete len:246 (-) Transcript_16782:149-886(-)
MIEALSDWGVEFVFCKFGKPEGRTADLSRFVRISGGGTREGGNRKRLSRNLLPVLLHRRGGGAASDDAWGCTSSTITTGLRIERQRLTRPLGDGGLSEEGGRLGGLILDAGVGWDRTTHGLIRLVADHGVVVARHELGLGFLPLQTELLQPRLDALHGQVFVFDHVFKKRTRAGMLETNLKDGGNKVSVVGLGPLTLLLRLLPAAAAFRGDLVVQGSKAIGTAGVAVSGSLTFHYCGGVHRQINK